MRIRRLIAVLVVLITAVVTFLFFSQRTTQADFGDAIALCPGPDSYGYLCEGATTFPYYDAKTDIFLYVDDGVRTVPLPFPFTFYGTTHTDIGISSNGNVQFGSENPAFANQCLNQGAASGMGDMIAPFWDDLDLLIAGTVDIDTIGEAPNRIFVVEWDNVPYKGPSLDERVTFALQLFEESNDILFLYQDVTVANGRNGRSATVGIQSENQGVALQFSCNQPAVSDASQLTIRHPEEPNGDLGQEAVVAPIFEPPALIDKAWLPDFTAQLNAQGEAALTQWQQRWLNQPQQQMAEWTWVDLTGNGRSDLILQLNSTRNAPEQSVLAVFTAGSSGQYAPVLYQPLTTRETAVSHTALLQTADLTADGLTDALLQLRETNQLGVLTQHSGTIEFVLLPEICSGSWVVHGENGRLAITQDGCPTTERTTFIWQDGQFQQTE